MWPLACSSISSINASNSWTIDYWETMYVQFFLKVFTTARYLVYWHSTSSLFLWFIYRKNLILVRHPIFFLWECLARYDLWALIIKSCFVCWSGSCISMLYNQRKMYNKYLFIYTENSFRLFHVRYLVRIMFTCLCKLLKSTVFAISQHKDPVC